MHFSIREKLWLWAACAPRTIPYQRDGIVLYQLDGIVPGRFAPQAQRRGDRLVAKEHVCRQCRFAGKGAAFLASELLEADDIDGPTGIQLPIHQQKGWFSRANHNSNYGGSLDVSTNLLPCL